MNRSFLPVISKIVEPLWELVQGGRPVVRWRCPADVVVDSWVEVTLLEEAS